MEWTHTVTPDEDGLRLDRMLAGHFGQLSRTRLQQVIQAGELTIDGRVVATPARRVHAGHRISLRMPPPDATDVEAENLPLEILYEDSDLVVVNKPPLMTSHPAPKERTGTLVNALLHHISDLSGIGGQLRPGIVHRLDKVTSGVMVVAKNDRAHRILSKALHDRRMQKVYYALALGKPREWAGVWDLPVGRDVTNRVRMTITPEGRSACTHYQVIRAERGLAWVRLEPKTGRTHQLRVHLAHAGMPIVLDETYGFRLAQWPMPELKSLLRGVEGICLHAARLQFRHPSRNEQCDFTAPLPGPLSELVGAIFPDWRSSERVQEQL